MIAAMQEKLIDWHLQDPKGKPIEEVRLIRDEIETKVADLAQSKDKSHFKAAL
jgi:protein-tyrosine-phosphatase